MDINKQGNMNLSYSGDFSEVGITDGLVGYWPLNGDLRDYANNNNSSTSNLSFEIGLRGRQSLQGQNGIIGEQITLNNSVLNNLSAITISFWSNQTANDNGNYPVRALNSAGGRVFSAHVQYTDGKIYWDCGSSGTTSYDRVSAAGPGLFNQWVYWTLTKDVSTGIMRIYYNNKLLVSGSGKSKTMTTINDFTIARDFVGKMQDLRIYNRVLDTKEMKILNDLYSPTVSSGMLINNTVTYIPGQLKEMY